MSIFVRNHHVKPSPALNPVSIIDTLWQSFMQGKHLLLKVYPYLQSFKHPSLGDTELSFYTVSALIDTSAMITFPYIVK